MKYVVDSVVCDYGVFEVTYENGEEHKKLKLICNVRSNALLIADIMNKDSHHEVVRPVSSWEYLKHDKARCKNCDVIVLIAQDYGRANYCPQCGAHMIKECMKNENNV